MHLPEPINVRRHEARYYINDVHNTPNMFPAGLFLLGSIKQDASFTQTTLSACRTPMSLYNVEIPVVRAGNFWSLGLRSLSFAATLLPWFFRPIPMFVPLYDLESFGYRHQPLHENRFPAKKTAQQVQDPVIAIPRILSIWTHGSSTQQTSTTALINFNL